MALQGSPGDECQAAFVIECDRSQAVAASFRAGLFVDEAGERALDIPVSFEPPEATIEPGASQQFVLAAAIPDDIPSGLFSALVVSEAMPDIGLRLRLTVDAPRQKRAATKKKPAARATSRKKPAKKKAAAKKGAAKKTATKKTGAGKTSKKKRTSAAKKRVTKKKR